MGVGTLLPFVAETDVERRVAINTIGATWEGNQVWFILGGGAIFAAWPPLYAISFSGFYLTMFLVLAALSALVLFALGGWAIASGHVEGYRITSAVDPNMAANPHWTDAVREPGAWMNIYTVHPVLWLAPGLGFLEAFGAMVGFQTRFEAMTFVSSKLAVFGIISTVGVSMFPFILPSSVQPGASLTVWDAASSHATLFNMLVAVIIFLPIVLVYTAWVYKVLWGKIDERTIERDNDTAD